MDGSYSSVTEAILQDFSDLPNLAELAHVATRLLMAALLGGMLGFEREAAGKFAGLRTHMLVTVGVALFAMIPQLEGMEIADQSRVWQGMITGIGFLGGGAILKLTHEQQIHGLTTAAGIWSAAAVGIAVGVGRLGTAILATGLVILILSTAGMIERRFHKKQLTPKAEGRLSENRDSSR